MSPIRPELLEADLKVIKDRRGEDAIHAGNVQPPIKRLEIDSPALMRVTGGGIPFGRITRFWGMRSSSKTLCAWLVAKAAQEQDLGIAYWNVEKQYDEIHVREHLGIDTAKNLFIGQTTVIEDIAREMDLLLRSIPIHIIDSTSFATSQDELAGDPGDWNRGLDARVWKKAMRRINDRMDKDESIVLLLDHAGKDMKTQAEYPKGGEALEYASSMSLHFRQGTWLYYGPDGFLDKPEKIKEEVGQSPSGQKEADGNEVTVRCTKSRVCRPFRVAKMRLDLNTFQFDTTFELFDAGTFFDEDGLPAHRSKKDPIIVKSGAWYRYPGAKKGVQGERAMRNKIREDPELAAQIRHAMLCGY